MNVVSENHADSFGWPDRHSRASLVAMVIGEGLRDNLRQDREDVPDDIRALLHTLETRSTDGLTLT